MNEQYDVAIVGAGAAGLATAVFLARDCGSASVLLLDGAKRIGAKILVSGGGRCNVTNVRVTPGDFYGGNPNVVRRILTAFDENQTWSFFEQLGVCLHEEEYGKLFPDTNEAQTVLDALLREVRRLGVALSAGHRVTAIAPAEAGFALHVDTGAAQLTVRASVVVLATGGQSLPKTGSDGLGYELARSLGHSIVLTTPALDPLVLDGGFHVGLSGISHEVTFTLSSRGAKPVRISGPMLWTHFGMSGPAALDVSRFWNRADCEDRAPVLSANFAGGAAFGDVDQWLVSVACERGTATLASLLHRWVPMRVASALCTYAGCADVASANQLTRDQRRALVHALVHWPVPVRRTRGYSFAEVTAGGIPLAELNPSTLESRVRPGLYVVGEIADVDGRIGGFNFQWAWSSGFVAGTAIARRLGA